MGLEYGRNLETESPESIRDSDAENATEQTALRYI